MTMTAALPLNDASEMPVAPPLSLLMAEMRVFADWYRARTRPTIGAFPVVGDALPVITLPGFMANDLSMAQMRANLDSAGFRSYGWGMGINRGAQEDTLERIAARVADITEREGRVPALVGWSLGGVFAREFAKQNPGAVDSVISMGSPFSGPPRANNAWRLYHIVTGHTVESPPIERHPAPKPVVPTYALWSARDGVIAPACARGEEHERDAAIELDCGHLSFAFSPEAVGAVIDCLQAARLAKAA